MKAPKAAPAPNADLRRSTYGASDTGARQSEVWDNVRKMQGSLNKTVGAPVNAAQSPSSLQLALENDKLQSMQRAYVDAIKAAGESQSDIIGYVFAVNGKLNSADVYPSNGLFRKMWGKLLNASVTEAIGHRDSARDGAPSIEAVTAFLADAERGKRSEQALNAGLKLDSRDGDKAYYFETTRASGWVHR